MQNVVSILTDVVGGIGAIIITIIVSTLYMLKIGVMYLKGLLESGLEKLKVVNAGVHQRQAEPEAEVINPDDVVVEEL